MRFGRSECSFGSEVEWSESTSAPLGAQSFPAGLLPTRASYRKAEEKRTESHTFFLEFFSI